MYIPGTDGPVQQTQCIFLSLSFGTRKSVRGKADNPWSGSGEVADDTRVVGSVGTGERERERQTGHEVHTQHSGREGAVEVGGSHWLDQGRMNKGGRDGGGMEK